jgi:PPOX class probable F420-dependent enzyme
MYPSPVASASPGVAGDATTPMFPAKEPAINGRPPRAEELAFIRDARVGRLATVDAGGTPSVVPLCFALIEGDLPFVVSVLDEKPKRVPDAKLARVRNIERNPHVALVVDRYDEDWSQLVFVQVRGRARLLSSGGDGHAMAIAALREKYPQYRSMAIEDRMAIVIEDLRANSWRGDGGSFG